MNKFKFLLILVLLFTTAYAADPYITSNNILYGDSVYFKIPFEYENAYAADISVTYSDNLEFKGADCGTDGKTAIYEDGQNVHFGFLPEQKPTEITFSFKAVKRGDAFVVLDEITVISDDFEETAVTIGQKTSFKIKSDAPVSGGSGGGGGSKNHGSGSSSAGSTVVSVPPTVMPTPKKVVVQMPFGDVVSNYWARDYISDLYEKEIISDAAYFRPEDFITRAEFVKLAVAAFNISATENQCVFSDVSEDDWFYPYVSAAASNGAVTGDNSLFYPEQNITREDICVILHRIIKSDVSADISVFTDYESISDYAVEAVSSLCGLSVINGNEDGTFLPQSFATRAQTAKMISAALKALN